MSPGNENWLITRNWGICKTGTNTVYLDVTEFYLPFNWVWLHTLVPIALGKGNQEDEDIRPALKIPVILLFLMVLTAAQDFSV